MDIRFVAMNSRNVWSFYVASCAAALCRVYACTDINLFICIARTDSVGALRAGLASWDVSHACRWLHETVLGASVTKYSKDAYG